METDATSHNIVACCWGVFDQQRCVCLHGPKSLTGFKLYATSANIVVVPCKRSQHVGPNNVACCWPTLLRVVGQQCCVRLHGPLKPMQTDATSHNIVSPTMLGVVGTCCVVHANKRNNCQHCWRLSKEAMHSGLVILKKDCNSRLQTCHEANIVVVLCKRA